MPCMGKEPADPLLKEVPSVVPSKHSPKHSPSRGLPSSPIPRGCTRRSLSHIAKHIQELGQAPGMLKTSAHTDAALAPSISGCRDVLDGAHAAPRSPSLPIAALPIAPVRTGRAVKHVAT